MQQIRVWFRVFQKAVMTSNLSAKIRASIIRGVLFLAPLWLSLMVLGFCCNLIENGFGAIGAKIVLWCVPADYLPAAFADGKIPGFGLLLGIVLLFGFGCLGAFARGRQLLGGIDALFSRIPLLRCIYTPSRKLIETIGASGKSFQKVVFVAWPSPIFKTMAFVSNQFVDEVSAEKFYVVFVPQMPNPTAGFLLVVPCKEVIESTMSVEDALNFGVSAGVLIPPSLVQEASKFTG